MRKMQLGKGGPEVSALGLGCNGFSLKRPRNDEEAMATIGASLDAGISFLDTADFYGMGHNESIVGKAIKGRRDEAFLSVKFGMMLSPTMQFLGLEGRPNSVKNFCAYSLQRLGVDVIDLYQPGRPDPQVPWEDTIGAVADLIKDGKVRYLGVSEVGAENLKRAHAVHPVTALEIEYSLACRFVEAEILPVARELGIGMVAYRVLADGLLSGMLTEEPKGHMVAPRSQGDNLKHNLEKVDQLKAMAQNKGVTTAQLAVAWMLTKNPDVLPLAGMSKRSRLAENVAVLDIRLSAEEMKQMETVFAPDAILGDRYPPMVMKFAAK